MKLLHLADLHLGKKIFGYSLLEDQKYFLDNTIDFILENNIEGVMISGDIYDVAMPSGEAIKLFDSFITNLVRNHIEAFIIPGNHDSKDRVGYLKDLISINNIRINHDVRESINKITSHGINFYLLPYATTLDINVAFGQEFKDYSEAFKYLVGVMNINTKETNVLLMHQMISFGGKNVELGGSEEFSIGTIQNIESNIFADFDYVALGHIHKAQKVSSNMKYCGSPLVYHKDETKYPHNYTIIDINNKIINIEEKPIKPLREVRVIRDNFINILTKYSGYKNDYIYAEVLDDPVEGAMDKLKNVFPYALSIVYVQNELQSINLEESIQNIEQIDLNDLFASFYKGILNKDLTDYQKDIVKNLLDSKEED